MDDTYQTRSSAMYDEDRECARLMLDDIQVGTLCYPGNPDELEQGVNSALFWIDATANELDHRSAHAAQVFQSYTLEVPNV